jgi:hypothetical protein
MRYVSLLLLLALCAFFGFAQKPGKGPAARSALYPSSSNNVIPHLTHGANWQSTLIIMNVSTEPSFYRIKFYSPDGAEAKFRTQSEGDVHELSGTLLPGGSKRIKSIVDDSAQETRYWAEIMEGSGKIQVTAVFGWRVPGNTPMDVSVPNVNGYVMDGIYFPFDNTEGYRTALAFANSHQSSESKFKLEARNEAGISIFSQEVTLDPRSQTAFILKDEFPQTANQRGVVVLRPVNSNFLPLVTCAPLVLQFTPEGSITYIPAYDEY